MKATIAQKINKRWELVRAYAPGLLLLRATLRPFDDIVIEEGAGPQPTGGDPAFFWITVADPRPDTRVRFTFRGETPSVGAQYEIRGHDGAWYVSDYYETSLDSVYDYLRQLPRAAHSFRRKAAR